MVLVSIFSMADDPATVAIVETIETDLKDIARVQLIGAGQARDLSGLNRWQQAPQVGVPVFVISASILGEEANRTALVKANPVLGNPNFRSYYVCADIHPLDLFARYSDLEPLADEAMVVTREYLDDVLHDLRIYVTTGFRLRFIPRFSALVWDLVRWMALQAMSVVRPIGSLLFLLGFPAAVALLVIVAIGWQEWLWRPLALVCSFSLGVAFWQIETVELWPWLGPRWRLPRDAPSTDENGSALQDEEQTVVRNRFREVIRMTTVYVAVAALLLGAGVIVFAMHDRRASANWLLWAFSAGLLHQGAANWSHRIRWFLGQGQKGLVEATLARLGRYVARLSIHPLPKHLVTLNGEFTEDEQTRCRQWAAVSALGMTSAAYRPLWRRRDRIFVSYLWADEEDTGIASIADALDRLPTPHFVDKRYSRSQFLPWRPLIASELARATHVLLVISPNMLRGRIVIREIKTIEMRWYFEMLPAVICVVDPEVAAKFSGDVAVPLFLRFLLAWCPRLTYLEAQDEKNIAFIIRQRRRHGRLGDWWALIEGPVAEARMFASLQHPGIRRRERTD